jgi:hypothetical protein
METWTEVHEHCVAFGTTDVKLRMACFESEQALIGLRTSLLLMQSCTKRTKYINELAIIHL